MEKILAVKNDKGSADRFSYEWTEYSQIIPEYEMQFLKWVAPLDKEYFRGKRIADAGCGIGRNSYWPLLYGAEEVYAFDYAYETSCVAQKNLALFPQATVLQKSIYDFKKIAYFDLVFSIGVVHHLEKPREAVVNLWQSVKKGGKLLVWVYGYEGNEFIVRSVNLLRIATSRLPLSLVHVMATFFTVPLHIGVKMGMFRSHPYFRQLADFRFWHTKSIVFDQLLPRIAHYWTRDQAIALFEGLPYASISASRVNNNSWTIIAEK